MTLEEKIAQVKENIARAAREAGRDPAEITLVAATKVQTSDTIRAGHRRRRHHLRGEPGTGDDRPPG